jgi:acetyl-CoA acetyltransferase family protein
MTEAFICDAVRTPIGRYGGALSGVRADDLGAIPLRALLARNPGLDPSAIEELLYGCANQAGEDNRNVGRMALLLAGLPQEVPAATVNRLCGSGMDAVGSIARAIRAGEIELGIAGGVESMSRAPFVMPKAESAFARTPAIYDTTIGWRFINPKMKAKYGVDQMPETAENVAVDFKVSREDQDAFAFRSQERAAAAQKSGFFAEEIVPVEIPQRKGDPAMVRQDEHPRETTLEALAGSSPSCGPTARSPPATPPASTTAPLPSSSRPKGGPALRTDAPRAGAGHGDGRRGAADHGHRPGTGHPAAAGEGRHRNRGDRPDRTQRGVRLTGTRGAARTRGGG